MIDDVFAAVADSTRRQILSALADGSRPVGDLVDELGVSQPTVSKHLKVLRRVGLVNVQASGQKRFYFLTPEPLNNISSWVAELSSSPEVGKEPDLQSHDAKSVEKPADEMLADEVTANDVDVDNVAAQQSTAGSSEIIFSRNSDGEELENGQPRVARQALDFTPLAPFTPESFGAAPPEVIQDAAGVYLPYASIVMDEQEILSSTESETEQAPEEGSEEKTVDARPAVAETRVEEPETAGGTSLETNPVEAPMADDETNNRGFLASITRWGRRRSR